MITDLLNGPVRSALVPVLAGLAVLLVAIAPLLDRVIFPEPVPPSEMIPAVGHVFHSEMEGVTQRVVRRERNLLWSEFTLHAYAPGPPPHVHTKFAERFRVERGVASIRLADRIVELRAGEEYLIPPGTVHQPFNATGEEVVIAGHADDHALPEQFGIFLSQAYGFFDASPANRQAPRALLQMSRFSPAYDAWLDKPPIAVQQAVFWVLGPIARLLGYRRYYAQYAPQHVAISVTELPAAAGSLP
jgi:mannose-6-phosphate isomerase-like protein (cupin superfamily)